MSEQEEVKANSEVHTGEVLPDANQAQPSEAVETPAEPAEIKKPELTPEQRQKLENQQKMYKILQQGALFLKFIHNDLERQKKEHLNRAQRRRFERGINKGQFTREVVEVYADRLQEIQDYIESQLNPKAPIDGAEFYAKLKEEAAKTCREQGGTCECAEGSCKNRA